MVYRAVLAGCGGMAKGWLKALSEAPELRGRVELVGLVDLNLAAAEALRGEFGLTGAATGTGSCSNVGGGGWTGCWNKMMKEARDEKKADAAAAGQSAVPK